ncbi:MAG: hypothetical protein ABIK68_03085, partial [bacterium]
MKKENRNKLLLALGVLVLVMLGCSELVVSNTATIPVRIVVSMPGESVPETLLLAAADSDNFFSDYDGQYTVSAVADDVYRSRLYKARDDMTMMLLGQFESLSQEEISKLTESLGEINQLLENMETVSCSGHVDDENSGYA